MHMRRSLFALMTGAVALVPALSIADEDHDPAAQSGTTTPIKHLVVIFQENVSFDHYFGTYPVATNPKGEPRFTWGPGTPSVNGLSEPLLNANPNLGNPMRLDRSQALTCDQGHGYTAEQVAFDQGLMDLFVQNTGRGGKGHTLGECLGQAPTPGNYAVMDYYDGNTVTALWNYAQRFAMSDNSFSTGFGPSTPGAFEVTAGNTFGATCGGQFTTAMSITPCTGFPAPSGPAVAQGSATVTGDPDPNYDACAAPTSTKAAMGGSNVGDLLNAKTITWGWFQGGFKPTSRDASGAPTCGSAHFNIGAEALDGQACDPATAPANLSPFCQTDYNPHHQPFMYWPQTANTLHLPPASVAAIGHQDQANHQYDLSDFWAAADHDNLPSVSYLKAPNYQDGHAGYSDPLDEQTFLVNTLNHLQRLDTWRSTAVVIAYDDSDGWYDHQMSPIFNQSETPLDALTGAGLCGSNKAQIPSNQEARCGFGPRQPLLVVSPWVRENSVDHSITSQTSVVRFIEDNWSLGRIGGGSFDARSSSLTGLFDFAHPDSDRLILNPTTGQRA